jgi:hypothetical protein
MAYHQIGPGAFVTNISFKDPKFDSTAAIPGIDTTSKYKEPFDWKVVISAIPGNNPGNVKLYLCAKGGPKRAFCSALHSLLF